jgi:hypothetical protein
MRYSGRDFSDTELIWIRRLITDRPEASRKDLSVLVCQKANWLEADSGLKDMSCRVAMLKMARDGHFVLPPPKTKHTKPYKKIRTLCAIEQTEITRRAGDLNLDLEIVTSRSAITGTSFQGCSGNA